MCAGTKKPDSRREPPETPDRLHQVVDGLGVGDAVGAVESRAAAPEQVRVRGEHGDAGEVGLHGLVGEIEKGLASVAVQKHVEAQGARGGVGVLGCAVDARVRGELVRGTGDLKADGQATVSITG
ncbi:hypothetical protein G7054_g12925 [Neopestalotiopsis clavispora]|nr:hypothetical protein G7054_g12925 [Neopestalotiopsis clavispora]